jgi:hypothetical protein
MLHNTFVPRFSPVIQAERLSAMASGMNYPTHNAQPKIQLTWVSENLKIFIFNVQFATRRHYFDRAKNNVLFINFLMTIMSNVLVFTPFI